MIPRPNHSLMICPSGVISHSTLKVRRSTPGLSEHRSSHRSLGSMGITLCTRYVDVALRRASSSRAESAGMKWLTSAMCTPTSRVPSGRISAWSASSRSRAVGGSMDATLTPVKSLLTARSDSGTSHVFPDSLGGTSGRHPSAATVKSSSPRMLFSAMSAAVSVSSSPAIPRDSLSWQCGHTYEVDHLLTLALTSIPLRPAPSFSPATAAMASGRYVGDMSTIIHGSLGSVGYRRSAGILSGYLLSFSFSFPFSFPFPLVSPPFRRLVSSSSANPTYPTIDSRLGLTSETATTLPVGLSAVPSTPPRRAAAASVAMLGGLIGPAES
mmetsp:Transcript_580/g.2681  ORF Transcript_580/g.2681 Transcript_580/m.2681 type:complete len:326 (-) Transcript_580:140-1117(-)